MPSLHGMRLQQAPSVAVYNVDGLCSSGDRHLANGAPWYGGVNVPVRPVFQQTLRAVEAQAGGFS